MERIPRIGIDPEEILNSLLLKIFSILLFTISILLWYLSGTGWLLIVSGINGIYISYILWKRSLLYRGKVSTDLRKWGKELDKYLIRLGEEVMKTYVIILRIVFIGIFFWGILLISRGEYLGFTSIVLMSIILYGYSIWRA